jgi:hypothetical protein
MYICAAAKIVYNSKFSTPANSGIGLISLLLPASKLHAMIPQAEIIFPRIGCVGTPTTLTRYHFAAAAASNQSGDQGASYQFLTFTVI